jgi:uncharacterized protein YndB with AHSA1/START domain
MSATVHSVEIDRGPEEVSAFVTNPAHFAEWQANVVSARTEGDGLLKAGSRVITTRRMGPREITMTSEYTEYDSPRGYAFRVLDGSVRAFGNGRFEPIGNGDRTRFTEEIDFEGHGILGKLLVALVVRRRAAGGIVHNLEDLKRMLSDGPSLG